MRSRIFDTRKGRHVWPKRTICEVHREIYDLLVLCKYDDIIPRLEEAYIMGIKLVKKLVDNKCSLPEWKNNDGEKARELRKLRIEMDKQLNEIGNNL